MDLLRYFAQEQTKAVDRPRLRAGDVVRVEMKIREAGKERLQVFEGTVLGVRGAGPSVTFTVRREVGRFAVERIFPLYSPLITSIDIVKRQKVRRAKLNYLRDAGRRRVKEDELAMQRHLKEEADKKRLAEEAKRRAEEAKVKEEKKEAAQKEAPEAQADAEQETDTKKENDDGSPKDTSEKAE